MATKRAKHIYLQAFGIIVMVLALVRCIFPGVAGNDKAATSAEKSAVETGNDTTDITAENPADITADITAENPADITAEKSADIKADKSAEKSADITTDANKPAANATKDPSARSYQIPALKASTPPVYLADGSKPHPIRSVHSYKEAFPDSNHVQLEAARFWGVSPVKNRADAEQRKNEVVYVGASPYYDVARLDASIPYLVPRASLLLQDIGMAFFDSLQVKGLPLHRLVVSSVLRTQDDVARLRRSNKNATEHSCHLYGTTFDINYNQYEPVNPRQETGSDKLKWVLSEVLNDMRQQGRCYIKYEVRQPCFHITIR